MDENVNHPRMEGGFLGTLRPYQSLNENNFHEVMLAIRVLAPELSKERLDRQLISALWGLCHFGRVWGCHPDGMLRSNNLIAEEDINRLEDWINAISYAVTHLLEGCDSETAFEFYRSLYPTLE